MSLFIGIDSGTQSVKAVVIDTDSGTVVSEARAPHRMIEGLPAGHMEQDPREWTSALDRVIAEALGRVERKRVRGIGVSGQQHGFVPLDGEGGVIRPAKLWCDTSTAAECAVITRKLGGPKAALRATGNLFLPGYTAPKILWLKRHEPSNFRRLRHILLPHDYLNYHLTGNYTMEPGDASGTALFDIRKREWSRAAVEAIDRNLADWLPPVTGSDQPAGILKPALASKFGLRVDVVVSAGGGDNMMGAVGTGNFEPGVVSASFGTSGTIYAFARKPVVDPHGEIAAFCSSTGGWLPLLCTMNVTSVTEAVRRQFGLDLEGFDAAVSSTPAGADGLLLLPYFSGERTPNVPAGRGVYFGATARNSTPGHYARAAMEGATLGMNYGLNRLRALGVKPREIRITGGGARSAAWRQIMADVFGVPVVAMREDEGAALGAALQAAWCVSKMGDGRWEIGDRRSEIGNRRSEIGNRRSEIGDRESDLGTVAKRFVAFDESRRCVPRTKAVVLYRELQQRQDQLGMAVRPLFT